eukprot:gene2896-36_t
MCHLMDGDASAAKEKVGFTSGRKSAGPTPPPAPPAPVPPNRRPAPGEAYDLSSWKLRTSLADPNVVEQPRLRTYQDENFHLSDAGAILGETGVPYWEFAGNHTLRATCRVVHAPGANPQTRGMVLKLRWNGGQVHAYVKERDPPYKGKGLFLGNYSLGDELRYEVRCCDEGEFSVTVNGRTASWRPPIAEGVKFFFKAGNYNGCNADCDPDDYAEVHFTDVNTTHGPGARAAA